MSLPPSALKKITKSSVPINNSPGGMFVDMLDMTHGKTIFIAYITVQINQTIIVR